MKTPMMIGMRELLTGSANTFQLPTGTNPVQLEMTYEMPADWSRPQAQVNWMAPGYDCFHQWRLYEGLTECYNYCTLCDEKEGEKA